MSEDKEVQEQDEKAPVEETTEETQEESQDESQESEQTEEESKEETTEEPEGKEEPEEAPEEKEPRPVYTMPVAKAQKEKERAVKKALEEAEAKHQAALEQLKQEQKPLPQSSDEIQAWADKYGYDKESVSGLVNIISKSIPQPDMSKLDSLVKENEVKTAQASASVEFDERVAPMIQKQHPQATPEHIAKVKESVLKLAFSKGYNTYPLEHIYKVHSDDFKFRNKHTAESSRGGEKSVDYSKITDKDIEKMTPEQYGEYSDAMARQESKYINS